MVPWLVPVLASAAALGFYDICKKHAVRDNSVMPVLFHSSTIGALALVLYLALRGTLAETLRATPAEAGLLMLKSLMVGSSWVCVYYAMRELPITLASPMRSTSPLWTFFGGVLLFREQLAPMQLLAAAVIFAGYFLFSRCGKLEGFTLRSRGMVLIIAGTLLGACCALYDKYLLNVLKLPRDRVQLYFMLGLVLMLGAAYLIRARCFGGRHAFEWRWSIPAIGLLLIFADNVYFHALGLPGTPISLVSLLRRMSCVVSFGVGALLFGERRLGGKTAALVLFLVGIALLALSRS